jgi:hypothetical protein
MEEDKDFDTPKNFKSWLFFQLIMLITLICSYIIFDAIIGDFSFGEFTSKCIWIFGVLFFICHIVFPKLFPPKKYIKTKLRFILYWNFFMVLNLFMYLTAWRHI